MTGPRDVPRPLERHAAELTPKALTAIENLRSIYETDGCGRYTVDVIGIAERPGPASQEQLAAVPPMPRTRPGGVGTEIGHLSDTERVRSILDLRTVA